MTQDLTTGRPERVLLRFCLPMFGSIVFQQLYNIADSLVAGRFISENALSAVGNGYQITLIFLAFAFGINIGCSVVVSNYFGAKKYGDMKTTIYTTFCMATILCITIMTSGLCFCDDLLRIIKTPDTILADSDLYIRIYIWGFPFLLFYNVANGIFQALGDSKTPFIFLTISSVTNILVDIFFVCQLNLGIAGVAYATFLCQGISCILSMAVINNRLKHIHADDKVKLFSIPIFLRIIVITVPSVIQQLFIALGNIIIQGVVNSFGEGVIAGYSTAVKLNNLVITSFTTIGNGMSNYTAQNLGAKKYDRVKAGFIAGVKIVWAISVPVIICYMIFSEELIKVFLDEPTAMAISTGVNYLRILAPFYLVISIKLVADGILRGGALMKTFMFTTFTDLILRVVLAIVLSEVFGAVGIWLAWPIGWSVATVMSTVFVISYIKSITCQQRIFE